MTQELGQQLDGLKARRLELEINEKVFIKVQGLNEQMEKARAEIGGLEDDNTGAKEELVELEHQRAELIKAPLMDMQKVMKSVMPKGKEAIIEITKDNEVKLGILSTSSSAGVVFSPHAGLSGSEQIMFDQALIYALMKNSDHTILTYEAAELGDNTLEALITALELEKKAQIVINSCHVPESFKAGKAWKVFNL